MPFPAPRSKPLLPPAAREYSGLNRSAGFSPSDWMVRQIEPLDFQHILEIGFGTGRLLEEVGNHLRVGFLAGIDDSAQLLQEASRRNQRLIENGLMELQTGSIHELAYPKFYFHTIYGHNVHFLWKEPLFVFLRLAGLLRSGGRLVMLFEPRWATTQPECRPQAELIRSQLAEAGLIHIRISSYLAGEYPLLSATAIKP